MHGGETINNRRTPCYKITQLVDKYRGKHTWVSRLFQKNSTTEVQNLGGNNTMRQETRWNNYTRMVLKVIFGLAEVFFQFVFDLVYGGGKREAMPPIKDLLLLESASSIALKIRTKKITCEQVLDSFIDRIREVNPVLNCVVADRFEEARKEAQDVDDLIRSDRFSVEELEKEKPLLGVPFTTKDCIAVKGLIHSSGLFCRKHIKADKDATSVARLKQAGAIPIGLTNVSELCMWWESSNNIHGRTNNPYDTTRIVGGSSGGEGCTQGCAASAFGIGSDIGGSIRMPAYFNGIFGHMTTPLAVPIAGQWPLPVSEQQKYYLRIGPMCRRAEDLLPLVKCLTNNLPTLRLDEPVDLKSIKFYYQESDGGAKLVSPVAADIRALFGKISCHLDKAHGIKANKVSFKRFNKSAPIWFANMKSTGGPTFAEQLTNLEGRLNPWWEFLKWTIGRSSHTLIALITCLADRGGCSYGDDKHQYLVNECNALRLEMLDLLKDDGVFLYPTHPTSAPYHHQPLVRPLNFSYTAIINVLKLPATTIPLGLDRNGLPIGIQVASAENNDRLCLAVARELEKAFGGWVPPEVVA